MALLKDLVKALAFFVAKIAFSLRFQGVEHLNQPGPLVLAANHVSWLDALLIAFATDANWKFIASAEVSERNWLLKFAIKRERSILLDPTFPFALRDVARYLQNGGKVVIFPEGSLSDTGRIRKFYEGVGFLLVRSGAKVIRCYIRGAENSVFARRNGPQKLFCPIELHFLPAENPPRFDTLRPAQRRQKVTQWLRNTMIADQFHIDFTRGHKNILSAIWNQASLAPSMRPLQDASLKNLSYKEIVVGAKLLNKALNPFLDAQEKRVAVLLPNVNATPVTLMALWETNRSAAILNFSSGVTSMVACAKLSETRTLITSRVFLERANISEHPFRAAGLKIVFLEDCRAKISSVKKLAALIQQILFPAFRPSQANADDEAVVLFTSGSEGTPKGVSLGHANIMANVYQCDVALDFLPSDKVFNALPMFHSFGLTLGTLLPLTRGFSVFLYPTPLHYRNIPNFVYNLKATVLLATNTFLNGYARRANPYDFRSLRRVFVGAEKLQQSVSKQWADVFGVRLLEGYGATECSPCISMNTPFDPRPDSAGRILPGLKYKLEPIEGVPQGGRLFVKGPNVMTGYLNGDPNRQFQSLQGWYDTGDVVDVCSDGFVRILGRLKRFAKVSGEMVSLTAVEELLNRDLSSRYPGVAIAVVSINDADKGEALVAVATSPEITLETVRNSVLSNGLTALSAPRHIMHRTTLPVLGSGKIDSLELTNWVQQNLRKS